MSIISLDLKRKLSKVFVCAQTSEQKMELISLAGMTQQERDEYLVYASAKICRGAGVDMPDEVAEQYMFFSERAPGYQLDLLDTVFNCLAFTLFPRALCDKERQAMQEMLAIDCEDEDVTNGIIMQLITYGNYSVMGKVPDIKKSRSDSNNS